jgi:hypothetical protein
MTWWETVMSIDALVDRVVLHDDGSGELRLTDRLPARYGEGPGIPGQSVLKFDAAPDQVRALKGLEIWGGASTIMLGEIQIARRIGYTSIVLCDGETFERAVAAYYRRLRED